MSGIGNQNTHSGDSVFNDVYIYGNLDYDFTGDTLDLEEVRTNYLTVYRNSWFGGIVTFTDDVFIEGDLDLRYLLVRDRLDVGVAGTVFTGINTGPTPGRVGVSNTEPFERFQVGGPNTSGTGENESRAFVVTGLGSVGIGTTDPTNFINYNSGIRYNSATDGEIKLDILGSAKIDNYIFDSVGSPGYNNWWLRRDEKGIRWVALTPSFDEGIFLQDEGQFIPVGAAQSFTTINFVQRNSLGLGTDTLIPTAGDPLSTTGGTGLATVFTKDLWGFDDSDLSLGVNTPIYRMTKVGIFNNAPEKELDVTGELHVTDAVDFDDTLNVDSDTTLRGTLEVTEKSLFKKNTDAGSPTDANASVKIVGGVGIGKKLWVGTDFDVGGNTNLQGTLDVALISNFNSTQQSNNTSTGAVIIDGGAGIARNLNVGENVDITGTLTVTNTTLLKNTLTVNKAVDFDKTLNVDDNVTFNAGLDVDGDTTLNSPTQSVSVSSGALVVEGGVGIGSQLNVGTAATIGGTLELEGALIDQNNSVAAGKTDYRLSSVGTGVSWRPPGVETENAIWVTMDGNDSNTGFLEGDAKRTVGAAASIAKEGDTIIIRSGTYTENNPIGLRTDVSVSGEDLRLVTIIPENRDKDVFHVRRGCLIQNLNFSGPQDDGQGGVSYDHTGCAAVAFPPINVTDFASTGYVAPGPANEGPSGRWKSPYVRNSTNFMTKSIGMKIDGNHANAAFDGINDLGQDLKSFVCDAFTQYNQNGIGVSITNNAYAQLVSIFTIASDIAIYCDTGGQCDLTNSNSSFGNYGLYADGVGATEFTATTEGSVPADLDVVTLNNCIDSQGTYRKPFDGQGLFFKIDLDDYNDTTVSGIMTQPLQLIRSIRILNGGLPGEYSASAPPVVSIPKPLGPESIQAELSANVSAAGTITSVDVITSGRNYLPNQTLPVTISGGGTASAEVDTDPILFTVSVAGEPTANAGLTTVTFNEFIPYSVNAGVDIELVRISRIITSSHSFEYIGAGTDINKANPFQGGEPITENEVVAINGGQVPYTSTDQKGNFRIGDGLTVDQTTSTIRGRDFNRAIQAQLTPLILALR